MNSSVIFISLAGLVALIFGVLFITSKRTVEDASNKVKEMAAREAKPFDKFLVKNNVGVGISLILIGMYLFFIAYYVAVNIDAIGG